MSSRSPTADATSPSTDFLDGPRPLGEGYPYHAGVGALPFLLHYHHCPIRGSPCTIPAWRRCILGKHVHGVLAVTQGRDKRVHRRQLRIWSDPPRNQIALGPRGAAASLRWCRARPSVDDLAGLQPPFPRSTRSDGTGACRAAGDVARDPHARHRPLQSPEHTHGHSAGDLALTTFAQTVLGNIRRADLAARYGGEEFVVLMPNTSAQEAFIVTEKVCGVGATDIELPGSSARPSHRECGCRRISGRHRQCERPLRPGRRRSLRCEAHGSRSNVPDTASRAVDGPRCTGDHHREQCWRRASSISGVTR